MPMTPEFLPEFALLVAGAIFGGVAIRLLVTRSWARAVGVGAASFALIALAFVSGTSDRMHGPSSGWREATKPFTLVPADSVSGPRDDDAQPSVSLVLGDVAVRVAASERYVLSLDDEPFLTIDSLASGLLVSCQVAEPNSAPRIAATIRENAVVYCGSGVEPLRPDRHTITMREEASDILTIRYADPHRIEVTGQFYVAGGSEPAVISLVDGIEWRGAAVPSGTSIDLRPQGEGGIRFERSGLIQVLP